MATVRYGTLKNIGNFLSKIPDLKKGDVVIIRSNRGVEIGEVINLLGETADNLAEGSSEILRLANEEDLNKEKSILEDIAPKEFKYCQKKIKELKLHMKLAGIEHLFGTKKIVIYFTAESRIDFRELVKDFAREYQARIEMKQIGVRDEARLLADYEHCGMELCCKRFLGNLEPVTMKMAKRQKATMDPSKISGRCGKLMCCLRYEDEVYEELRRKLPKKGTFVEGSRGSGEVIDYDVISQNVIVETDDKKRIAIPLKEIIDKKRTGRSPRSDKFEEYNKRCKNECN